MCTALLSWVVRVWSATEIRLAKWAVALSSEWPMSMHSRSQLISSTLWSSGMPVESTELEEVDEQMSSTR